MVEDGGNALVAGVRGPEVTTAELAGLVVRLAACPAGVTEAENIARLRVLEELKAACAGAQVRETTALQTARRDAERARGVPARRQGRGLAGEIALARRESPWCGSRWLTAARTLTNDLPHTLAAVTRGALSEARALLVVRETTHLSPAQRRELDARLAGRIHQWGDREVVAHTRAHAHALDPRDATERARTAERDRLVTIASAAESMVHLSALLPKAQGIAAWQALGQATGQVIAAGRAAGRTRDQVRADLLVELLTGQETATAVPVEVHLIMTDTTLHGHHPAGTGTGVADPAEEPAWLVGHGPLPAQIARDLLAPEQDGPSGTTRVWLRRLYTHPESGHLVAMDSRRRVFPALLRRMIILRDDTSRTPWCDAPIRHTDHATPHARGGPTTWTNSSGLCERCNHTKENPGWRHRASPEHLTITTPTGHAYHHDTPPLRRGHPPRPPSGPHSRIEHHLHAHIDIHWLPHAS